MGRGTTGAPACWALREMRRAQSRWVLTLQQFRVNLGGSLRRSMYSPSLDLKPKDGADLPQCEIDFVWLIPRPYPGKTAGNAALLVDPRSQSELRAALVRM